jgi:PHD/YefM family antitoxin component YafN of YafNO toxin-antitoxin module
MTILASVVSAIRNTVPITQFNRGFAGQIFEDVKAHGAKVVMKNNAECVLLSPDEYVRLMDELNDARLLALAAERLSSYDPSARVPEEKVWERLGITDEEMDAIGEVEFE